MKEFLHYRFRRKLGEGKNGVTYLAWDLNNDRLVAAKILENPAAHEKDWRHWFLAEMEKLSSVDSEYVARFHSLEKAEGNWWVIRDYVEGEPAARIAERGPVHYDWFLETARQAAAGLAAAHDQDVLHGNIRSSNLIVDSTGRPTLVDFCLDTARIAIARVPTPGRETAFPAPEQMTGDSATIQSDICTLGAVLYHLLAGRPLVAADNPEWRQARILDQIVGKDGVRKKTPPEARLLFGKLLAEEPSERFSSAEELRLTLREIHRFSAVSECVEFNKKSRFSARQYLTLSILVFLLIVYWWIITSYQR